MKLKALVLALFATAALTGCTTLTETYRSNQRISDKSRIASNLVSLKPAQKRFLMESDKFYVDTQPIRVSDTKAALLDAFPYEISISDRDPLSMQEIAERITINTKIPVTFLDMQGVAGTLEGGSGAPVGGGDMGQLAQSLPMGGAAFNPAMMASAFGSAQSGGSALGMGKRIDVRFHGKLTDFLDQVTARFNLFWRYDRDERRIVIHQYDTQTFTIFSMPGNVEMNFDVTNTASTTTGSGSSSGGGGGGGGTQGETSSGQSVRMSSSIKSWNDVTESVQNMLSKAGRSYGNEAMGTITVTDTPVVLAEVRRYVENLNKAMARQVTLNVAIYNIELDDSHKGGIDWNVVYQEADDIGLALVAPAKGVDTLGGFAAKILKQDSKINGSQALLKAFEEQGKVSLVANTQAVTMNNSPVPVKIADETTYLSSSTSGATAGSSGQGLLTTGLTPGKVVTGLTMTLLPKVVDANQLMLQMAFDMSALKEITTITSGTQSIQAPKITTKNFVQKVALHNGETLIMAGFNSDEDRNTYGSTLDLPGSLDVGRKRVVTVLMVTPMISDGIQ